MNNTTNNSKTNHTEIGNNINRSSQFNANNDQDINLKSHSIYRRFLPGLLMLLLGVVILSAPVEANAQITDYELPDAYYFGNPFGQEYLHAISPTIYADPGTIVAYRPVLYQQDIYGNWKRKYFGNYISGMVDNSSVWTGNTFQFDCTRVVVDGNYLLAYELYYYNGARWVMQVNEWGPGFHIYVWDYYTGFQYWGYATVLNHRPY
jgi:hypothetical protein